MLAIPGGISMKKTDCGSAVRIKDIAQLLGVSSVSVHRALSGKEGISDSLRQKILDTADEMGYTANYAAASIKRKASRIAVVLPVDASGKSYYYDYIWKGIREQAAEVRGLNVEVVEYRCNDEDEQFLQLKAIANAGTAEYSGVITYSFTQMPKVLMQLQRLITLGIATVVVDNELQEPEGISCITANEKATGCTMGELISLVTPESGTVIVSKGRLGSNTHQTKLQSLVEFLSQKKPNLKLVSVGGYYRETGAEDSNFEITRMALQEHPDTVAMCAMTSFDNLPMEKAVRDLGLRQQVKLIGIDLNDLTAQMLMEERIDAVVSQGAFEKGCQAVKLVTDNVIKGIPLPNRTECAVDIILKSNLKSFGEI